MNSATLSKLGLSSSSKSSTQGDYERLKAVIERAEVDLEDCIGFLEAKRLLDEQYAGGLDKLQRRPDAGNGARMTGTNWELDTDAGTAPTTRTKAETTLNKAWEALRSAAMSIATEHSRLASATRDEFLPPLFVFRDSQRRSFQAVKNDIKNQSKEYNDLRWNQLAKLKKAYDLKSEELEKAAAKVAAKGEALLADPDASFGDVPSGESRKFFNLGDKSSGSKTFKLAEELKIADLAYRNGVTALEECRVKLQDCVEKGFKELARLETERVELLMSVAGKYARVQEGLAAKSGEMSQMATTSVGSIKPDADLTSYLSDIRQAWTGPEIVPYEKYRFGKLKDLTFGLDLEKHLLGKGRQIPLVVEKCVKTLERRGLEREGLYRVPALASAVTSLRTKHEQDETVDFDVISEAEDVNVVAALLKLYFRELPASLFALTDRERAEYSKITDQGQRMLKLRSFVRAQSQVNRATLKYTVDHLNRVAMNSHQNRMTVSSLAKIFGAIIFSNNPLETKTNTGLSHEKRVTNSTEAATAAAELFKADCVIMEDLCNMHQFVFEPVEGSNAIGVAIPPRRESQRGLDSPTTSISSAGSNGPKSPSKSVRSERSVPPSETMRAMVLDAKGPLAMP